VLGAGILLAIPAPAMSLQDWLGRTVIADAAAQKAAGQPLFRLKLSPTIVVRSAALATREDGWKVAKKVINADYTVKIQPQ
jgi:hypothetical protein